MKVSVCIATYNGEKYIEEQIKSILPQLSINDEVIISDDHSTDNTINIIKNINDQRIKIYFNNAEKGYTRNFENAIKKAKGEVIFLSDQDDIWLRGKVKHCLEKLKNYDFVVTDGIVVNETKEIIYDSLFKICNTKSGIINNLVKNRYYGCCMAFNRRVLKKALPFPKNQNFAPHDVWLPIVAELYYKTTLIKEPLMLYRRHENNVSCFRRSNNSLIKKFLLRIYPLYKVISIRNRGE